MDVKGLRLNLGCGKQASPGWTRLDISDDPAVAADIVCDIRDGIPLPDDSVVEMRCWHILEHVLDVEPMFAEIWRVCRPGATVDVRVPHYMHHAAYDTLDHVRYFSPGVFVNLDRSRHEVTAFRTFFRFRCERLGNEWSEEWKARPDADLSPGAAEYHSLWTPNAIHEIHAVLRAVKP